MLDKLDNDTEKELCRYWLYWLEKKGSVLELQLKLWTYKHLKKVHKNYYSSNQTVLHNLYLWFLILASLWFYPQLSKQIK